MDVAVIGIACRFPGANDHHMFWANIAEQKSSVSEVPTSRWDWQTYWGDSQTQVNKTFSKWGGFLNEVDTFDNQFFGVLPKVAQSMDPQQRIMLEMTWSCLEDAGIPPSQLRGKKVGVIFGVFNHDYKELQERGDTSIEAHNSTGTATAIIANRVSHYFDFRGPSIPIDTACSSSLNAIHSAIQAIEHGDCEMAIAGGINLMLTPTRHISFSKMGMLSPTGSCKTFDDRADGYVRGEGAGLLLLKPLDKALADGDSIHGVIKGSAVNHCGETYTLTYPSARAQSEVIIAAHDRAGIPIGSVSYVEAHGTGTPKGDPIEFEGLLTAFRTLAEKQGSDLNHAFCGLSSVKTNIGHLEAAAGVAGIIKVLMAFKHRTLPAMHDFSTLNSKISLDGTPFYILNDTREWAQNDKGQPRRAGVSSFGFGGTNAHLILEEAPPSKTSRTSKAKSRPYMIVLSAKNSESLLQKKKDLLAWFQDNAGKDDLAGISATLLTGRDHFQHRFACTAVNELELITKIEASIAPESDAETKGRDKPTPEIIQSAQSLLDQLQKPGLKAEKYSHLLEELANMYIVGVDLAWSSLFGKDKPRGVALPTYPFSQDRFWISPNGDDSHFTSIVDTSHVLHPVLQRNVSTIGKQRYTSTFTGKEFFLADHVVKTNSVLPGVVYLEMVRAAIVDAIGEEQGIARLSDVVWMRPLEVKDQPVSVHVELHPRVIDHSSSFEAKNVKHLAFQVTGGGSHSPSQVYCRGNVDIVSEINLPPVDIVELKRNCNEVIFSADQCYQLLARQGLNYGPSHQAIVQLQQSKTQCVADLSIPVSVVADSTRYVIHPSTADAGLQAAVAFAAGSRIDSKKSSDVVPTFLPFALEQVEVYGPCSSKMSAWVRYSTGSSANDVTRKFDIDFIDSDGSGRILLALRGLSIRPMSMDEPILPAVTTSIKYLAPPPIKDALYSSAWVAQSIDHTSSDDRIDQILIIGDADDVTQLSQRLKASASFASTRFEYLHFGAEAQLENANSLQVRPGQLTDYEKALSTLSSKEMKFDHVLLIASDFAKDSEQSESEKLTSHIAKGAQSLFALIKAMIRGTKRAKFLHIVPNEPVRPEYLGLSGFYKTLRIEKPSFTGRVVQCDVAKLSASQLAGIVFEEFSSADRDIEVRYDGDVRSVRKFRAFDNQSLPQQSSSDSEAKLRQGGTYLITGGMGALGLIFARHLCTHYQANLYLTGRTTPTGERRLALDELSALGGKVSFLACDVSKQEDVRRAISSIHAEGHQLNGVIHSAGVIEDNFILRKDIDSFSRVVAPKTMGSVYLDIETRDEPLDFFALFSSVTGVLGNIGQCDYSFANAFEDYFAAWREDLRHQAVRKGKTISLNWPYWKDGGMRLSDQEEQALHRSFGLIPLLSQQGVEVFEYSLTQAHSQLVVMPGDVDKIREVLGVEVVAESTTIGSVAAVSKESNTNSFTVTPSVNLRGTVSNFLATLFAEQLQISVDFDEDRPLREYGFDSVVMIDLVHLLEKRFANLPKTLFFEHQTLNELTTFLIENYPDPCHAIAQPNTAAANAVLGVSVHDRPHIVDNDVNANHLKDSFGASNMRSTMSDDDDIAIVGLSGRYPQAENLEQFWENLKIGRDCVVEIPSDRWDIETTFQPGPPVLGKTYSKWGGFLNGVDQFDPLFFNISPKEAENMDPHERLFLETVALTIEDAGYTPDKLAAPSDVRENPVGVYVGVMWGDYQLHGVEGQPHTWATPHSFYWAVANRVSHCFNFSGPSITIDTACSSSLTAIHLACAAIRSGEISAAIAGAVNLSLHVNKYNLLADMRFLSTDGRCRSFGEGGDGYVPGEGVGAVLLKSLSKARADGDHIYGIIRGTSVNHGGKTSGFTVPNPKRQAALVREALQTAGVDPRHISYLEAHGTGTSLGDPIEIAGLNKAFAQSEHQYCSIGSVKSNIGHLEAASGIAGLTKILLQMKHRTLVPSIQSDVLNPHIDFQNCPFYVQRTLQEWNRPLLNIKNSSGNTERIELPRLAGISSFGAGGSNAHMVVEEYVESTISPITEKNLTVPILLSARRESALKAMAENLAAFIETHPDTSLQDAAYTLQVGRVAMEFRLAVITANATDLIAALRAYVDGTVGYSNLFTGHRDNAKNVSALPVADWIAQQDLHQLSKAWVNGQHVEWANLHAPHTRKRLALPGYVYQRQRYWVTKSKSDAANPSLHPLIDTNVSTLEEQTFRKTFRPSEFFLRDHQLGNNRILPGVAYLEMALAAGQLATREQVSALRDVRWFKPIFVNEGSHTFDIGLIPERDGIHFEVYQQHNDSRQIYSQGVIGFDGPMTADAQDIQAIVARCKTQNRETIAAAFAQIGFNFGSSFQVIETLYFNADEALAKLSLPADSDLPPQTAFTLHPALMDGAIRTSLGIGGFGMNQTGVQVPVSLSRIEVLHSIAGACFAYALRNESGTSNLRADQRSYDIDLLDAAGKVLARIGQLVIQPAPSLGISRSSTKAAEVGRGIKVVPLSAPASPAPAQSRVVDVAAGTINQEALQAAAVAHLVSLLSAVTKVPAEQINPKSALENYGIDSVMILSLTEKLQVTFGEVPKTLFYEYQDLQSLSEYFLDNHAEQVRGLVATSNQSIHVQDSSLVVSSEALDEVSPVIAGKQPVLLRLFRRMKEFFGSEAQHCSETTPLADWPINPISHVGLTHALLQEFNGIDTNLLYSYTNLSDWADAIQGIESSDNSVSIADAGNGSDSNSISFFGDTGSEQIAIRPTSRKLESSRFAYRASAANTIEHQDIAIIGLSGRYPGAKNVEEFWQNLSQGVDGISEIPASRWNHERHHHPDRNVKGKVYSKWGGFVDDIDQFDASFFGMSPREAEITDPQERLFLQTAWECLEDACYTRQALKDRDVGVFVGVMWGHYENIDVSPEQQKYGRPAAVSSSIANRVSYFLNLNGPSVALDTMCSSSLTAIHLACQAIRNGDCQMAIAGGVNLIVHPVKYHLLSQGQFLSSDGRCRAFGDGGDGYVPGEGVGAVLLKPLDKAIEDGDHILGVIKGSAVNHGGKTNGYTVPNQNAQGNVISKALRRAGWHPSSIGYIEAHGTGTSLGDPIEIAGLSQAFASVASSSGEKGAIAAQSCRIGSVKSNIGHLESAAGIAALTKVLMQLRHRSIAPSLHSVVLNSNIDFSKTPFRVVQSREEWHIAANTSARRAGISSFGAGGSNAHVLIEEYVQKPILSHSQVAASPSQSVIFVLSADSEERLTLYIDRVQAFLLQHQQRQEAPDLHSLAYSSLVGREAMNERLAIVTSNIDGLIDALAQYRKGVITNQVQRGSVKKHNEKLDAILDDAQRDAMVRSLVQDNRLPQLARAWVSLLDVEWGRYTDLLFPFGAAKSSGAILPHRISFPVMPFLTKRYWVQETSGENHTEKQNVLHPLLDRNVSVLTQQRYAKLFTGNEFYLRDHIVETGERRVILPGVAYLEMARAAGDLAMGDEWQVNQICNVIWIQPLEVKGAYEEATVWLDQNDDAVEFGIQRESTQDTCAEGELHYRRRDDEIADEWIDVDSLRNRCIIEEEKHTLYDRFWQMGFHYGNSFQVTERCYRMADGALSYLRLPDALRNSAPDFSLHPSLFDGALRTCLAIGTESSNATTPMVPFALDKLEIFHPLAAECYAYATEVVEAEQADVAGNTALNGASLRKYNIVVTDLDGRVLIKLWNFSARLLVKADTSANSESLRSLQYYGYGWTPSQLESPTSSTSSNFVDQTILVITNKTSLAEALLNRFTSSTNIVLAEIADAFDRKGERHFRFNPEDAGSYAQLIAHLVEQNTLPSSIVHYLNDEDDFNAIANRDDGDKKSLYQGISSIRHLFNSFEKTSPGERVRCAYVFDAEQGAVMPQHDAIAGYSRSLLTINHRFELFTVRISKTEMPELATILQNEFATSGALAGLEVAHWSGSRHLRSVHEIDEASMPQSDIPFKNRGVYLITGGAGKLGLVMARHLASKYQARLVLTGRTEHLHAEVLAEIESLKSLGADVHYRHANIAMTADAEALLAYAKQIFGELNGVLHCAGVSSDVPITELNDASFAALLAPKIDGLLVLDQVTQNEALDFFVNFSSVSAMLGDLGSGAYAIANRFMDSHAVWRHLLFTQGRRFGKSISIGWPLWATGGMQISAADVALFNFSGMAALTEEEGVAAFESLLRSDMQQVLVAVGDATKIKRALRVQASVDANEGYSEVHSDKTTTMAIASERKVLLPMAPKEKAIAVASADAPTNANHSLQHQTEQYIKTKLAAVVKVAASDIDSNTTFEQLGMDSVMMMELRNNLNADFSSLPKTVLFEYDTSARMAQYLLQQHEQALQNCLENTDVRVSREANAKPVADVLPMAATIKATMSVALPASRKSHVVTGKSVAKIPVTSDAIAVIGLAGQFPQAANLVEFWDNLQQAKDCLSPIPGDRWEAKGDQQDSRSSYANKGGFLSDADRFDPDFFRMSQHEAAKTDPQLRVLLRAAWHAIEDAAYTVDTLTQERVGVYVGAMNEDFTWIMAELYAHTGEYPGPGTVVSELANRISFLMNLRGPSFTVSTACSSSLTALHLARQSILRGECDMALAGGVNLSLHPSKYMMLRDMKVLSPDGQERTFDEAANGLVPSEGVGMVVLKRLSRALADGDQIYGVVRGSSISHAGTGAGQYLPNLKMLEDTAARSLDESGLQAEDLSYIESHGTGTELGDPIELKGLANALRRTTSSEQFCAIGTKANLGHMEAASGICSLIKVLLSMKYGRLSPCAKLSTVNYSFDQEKSPFHFPREAQAWKTNHRGTRVAGINSFGMGGSNAFVIVESHEAVASKSATTTVQIEPSIVVLSAKSEERLRAYAEELLKFLAQVDREQWTTEDFANLAYSSQIGRTSFDYRLAIVALDHRDCIAKITQYLHASTAANSGVFSHCTRSPDALPELFAGEAGQDFIAALLQSRQWNKLASIWTRGCAIDWTLLHNNASRKRISFPAYPFESIVCDLRNVAGARNPSRQSEKESANATSHVGESRTIDLGTTPVADSPISHEWFSLDNADNQTSQDVTNIENSGDEMAKQYWLDHLQDIGETNFTFAPSLLPEYIDQTSFDDLPIHTVSTSIDLELAQSLQRCTQLNRIEIETLVAAAWAILINRYTKARCSQFGITKALAISQRTAESASDSFAKLRNFVPIRICTTGREKISGWLGNLQRNLNRKRDYAHVPIHRIESWIGIENLFDSAIAFEKSNVQQSEANAIVTDQQSALPILENTTLPSCVVMQLTVRIHNDTLELKLDYRSSQPEEKKMRTLLEHFEVLLEGLAANSGKTPAALPMRTKRESRETFWKALDKVNQ